MTPRSTLALALSVGLLLLATQALAAPGGQQMELPLSVARTVTYSSWTIDGSEVRLTFTLPHAARMALAAKGARPLDITDVGSAVLNGVAVSSRGGPCEAIDQGEGVGQVYALALDPSLDRFQIIFQCPDAGGIVLHDHVLFDRVPAHVNFAKVAVGRGKPWVETFTRDRQEASAVRSGPFGQPIASSLLVRDARTVFQDPLRICAVLAVVLMVGGWPDTLKVLAAVALGYGLAFVAAASGFQTPDIRLARSLEGLITVVIAAGAVLARTRGASSSGLLRVSFGVALLLAAGALALALPKGIPAILAVVGAVLVALALAASARRDEWRSPIQLVLVVALAALDGLTQTTLLSPLEPTFGMAGLLLAETVLGAAAAFCAALLLAQAGRWLSRGRLARSRGILSEFAAAGLAGAGLFWFATQLYSL